MATPVAAMRIAAAPIATATGGWAGPLSTAATNAGWVGSTMHATAISTICPALRSSTTARAPRAMSPESPPCRTARSTSPSTPLGSTALRKVAR
jgi:hypothetical protein